MKKTRVSAHSSDASVPTSAANTEPTTTKKAGLKTASEQPLLTKGDDEILLEQYAQATFRLFAKSAEAVLDLSVHLQRTHDALVAKGGPKLWRKFASDPQYCPVNYSEASRRMKVAKADKILRPFLHLLPDSAQSIIRIADEALKSPGHQAKVIKHLQEGTISPRSTGQNLKELWTESADAGAPINPEVRDNIASELWPHYKVTLRVDSMLGKDHLATEIRELLKGLDASALRSVEIEEIA